MFYTWVRSDGARGTVWLYTLSVKPLPPIPYSADYNTRVHYSENRNPLDKIEIQIVYPGTLYGKQ